MKKTQHNRRGSTHANANANANEAPVDSHQLMDDEETIGPGTGLVEDMFNQPPRQPPGSGAAAPPDLDLNEHGNIQRFTSDVILSEQAIRRAIATLKLDQFMDAYRHLLQDLITFRTNDPALEAMLKHMFPGSTVRPASG